MASLSDFALNSNFIQIINFNNWSRTIKGTKKESCLDHIYVNNIASIDESYPCIPCFGDHALVIIKLNLVPHSEKTFITRRDSPNTPQKISTISYCVSSMTRALTGKI